MNKNERRANIAQIPMPGMPDPASESHTASCCTIEPGAEVLYIGKVGGGPRYGSRGIVKMALHRKAIVDMGLGGTWHVPYYFLGVPKAA
ncbi:MAG: hypothetical protein O3A47_09345 [Chloroflexi bacterium]|nr:hypothetical protein [Chloroflexota bacterium]